MCNDSRAAGAKSGKSLSHWCNPCSHRCKGLFLDSCPGGSEEVLHHFLATLPLLADQLPLPGRQDHKSWGIYLVFSGSFFDLLLQGEFRCRVGTIGAKIITHTTFIVGALILQLHTHTHTSVTLGWGLATSRACAIPPSTRTG